ncbi:MAG TPA: sortase, partial [Candidatus Polarisedimenticolaceae bacterium]|nr:sortase [Candidatus Polarisedimenticolaceae bacterium]
MPSPKPTPTLKLNRSIPEPRVFHPTKVWVKHPYVYRYDAKRQICKRTSIDDTASGVGGYFSVIQASAGGNRNSWIKWFRRLSAALISPPVWTSRAFAAVFVTASATFLYPFVPAIHYRLSHQANLPQGVQLAKVPAAQPASANNPTNRVIIPSIGVNTPILESSSLAILDSHEGVWHQTGTLQTSNFVIAGHRFKYLPPNTTTFYNLDKLAPGDV